MKTPKVKCEKTDCIDYGDEDVMFYKDCLFCVHNDLGERVVDKYVNGDQVRNRFGKERLS